MGASCLITSPSEFDDPTQQTPPFLSAHRATPPLWRVVYIDDPSANFAFTTIVQSQDQNNRVFARLYLDYPANTQSNLLAETSITPSTLSDTEGQGRNYDADPLSLTWRPATTGPSILTPGCHTITLTTSHAFQPLGVLPVRENDVDSLVWWVYVPPGLFQVGAAGTSGQAGAGAGGQAGGLPDGSGGSPDTFANCLHLGAPL